MPIPVPLAPQKSAVRIRSPPNVNKSHLQTGESPDANEGRRVTGANSKLPSATLGHTLSEFPRWTTQDVSLTTDRDSRTKSMPSPKKGPQAERQIRPRGNLQSLSSELRSARTTQVSRENSGPSSTRTAIQPPGSNLTSTPTVASTTGRRKFTTNQDHSNPNRQYRPRQIPTPSQLPANRDRDDQPTGPFSNLQNELFQLHLVQQDGTRNLLAHESHVKQHLQARWHHMQKEYAKVASMEQLHRTERNLVAVQCWNADNPEVSFLDQLRVLSEIIQYAEGLRGMGELFDQCTKDFTEWHTECQLVFRRRSFPTSENMAIFIPPLRSSWLLDAARLVDGVTYHLDVLSQLPNAAECSMLQDVMNKQKTFLTSLRSELQLCRNIHRQIMQQEESFVASSLLNSLSMAPPTKNASATVMQVRRGVWEN